MRQPQGVALLNTNARAMARERAPQAQRRLSVADFGRRSPADARLFSEATAVGAQARERSAGDGRERREESVPVEARQSRRCRAPERAWGRDPGEWSRWGDESPEAAVSAGTKPFPTAANGWEL